MWIHNSNFSIARFASNALCRFLAWPWQLVFGVARYASGVLSCLLALLATRAPEVCLARERRKCASRATLAVGFRCYNRRHFEVSTTSTAFPKKESPLLFWHM